MSELIHHDSEDSALVEGLSHDKFVVETACELLDEELELGEGFKPNYDRYLLYTHEVYGVSDYQALRALNVARNRRKSEIGPELLHIDDPNLLTD